MNRAFDFHHISILGAGGAGMNGIAQVLMDDGADVTGYDLEANAATKYLVERGAEVIIGSQEDAKLPSKCDLLLVSSAAKADHSLIMDAKKRGVPVWTRHDLFAYWSETREIIAITGTHGKTTTTAMAAHILRESGSSAGYLVGIHGKGAGRSGDGKTMIIEADEYAKTFLSLRPKLLVIGNMDYDHVDIYPTRESYEATFRQFIRGTQAGGGRTLVNGNSAGSQQLSNVADGTFGGNNADVSVKDITTESDGIRFTVVESGAEHEVFVPVWGRHNVENTVAAMIAARGAGVTLQESIKALKTFQMPYRRQNIFGESGGILYVEDYAHLPEELTASIVSAREHNPDRRIVAVFQPHTASRLEAMMGGFSKTLELAHKAYIVNIYGTKGIRAGSGKYTSQDLADLVPSGVASGSVDETITRLQKELQVGDIVLSMNAGDAVKIAKTLYNNA